MVSGACGAAFCFLSGACGAAQSGACGTAICYLGSAGPSPARQTARCCQTLVAEIEGGCPVEKLLGRSEAQNFAENFRSIHGSV